MRTTTRTASCAALRWWGDPMDVQKLAAEIVDQFCPACVTTGSGVSNEQVRNLMEAQLRKRDEHILVVRSMIADAMTPDDE